MNTCPNCNGRMTPLFTSSYCANECDKPKSVPRAGLLARATWDIAPPQVLAKSPKVPYTNSEIDLFGSRDRLIDPTRYHFTEGGIKRAMLGFPGVLSCNVRSSSMGQVTVSCHMTRGASSGGEMFDLLDQMRPAGVMVDLIVDYV